MKHHPLHTLPNREGYSFTGVFRDGSHRACVVEVDAAGCHTVREWAELVGWMTNAEHAAAARLFLAQPQECSICRGRHGREITHACE